MPTLTGGTDASYCSTASTLSASVVASTFNSVTYSADLNKVLFKSNTYEANFFTGGNSLIHFEGAPVIYFNTETFNNNGDMS